MEEATKLTSRDRRLADSLAVIPVPAPPAWERVQREPHLLDYLLTLRKHQWLILTFLLTVVTVVTIASFKMKPVYVAAASLEVDRENHDVTGFQGTGAYDEYMDMEDYIETQSKILQSETLALQTIKSLDLSRYSEFGGRSDILSLEHGSALQKRPGILGAFLGSLSVKRVPNTRLLEVTFEAQDPQLAAQVVNTHLQNFIEQNFRSRYEATTQASNWLSSELEELRIKMEKSEDARIAYERENQIWTIDEKQNITTQKLADLSKDLTEAQSDLLQRQAAYQLAHSDNIDSVPLVRDSPVIQDLLKRQSELDEQYTDAVSQFGPNYPRVQRLQAQKKDIESSLEREKHNVVSRIDGEYKTARDRVALMQDALDKQKAEDNSMSEKLVQYNILKHDAESNKQLYDGLLQKLKEAGITAGLRSSNIRVVDPAMIPTGPSRPQKARNILLALLVGLVGGVGLAFFREYLDNTIKSPDDVEMLSGLPSLAVVPQIANMNGFGRLAAAAETPGTNGSSETHVELHTHRQPKSQISEAFRALRTSLLLSQADHPPQVILVTSALPREGKTTATVNLAVTLAQLGDRTLLIDSDLRKPGVRNALNLNVSKDVGLSSYLAGVATLEEATVAHPTIPNLVAMPTGPVPPNPADLLSSHRMREAISWLRQHYKFIVIDSPPIMAATDAVILSALADGVLLVVRSGGTPKEAFLRTRDLLMAVKCHLLGVVLNAVDSSAPDYYYSYRYYPYNYGYGEEGKEPKHPFGGGGR
ncbi:MAG TPA: polysaccharide biosynthesis tyrosine autokinase [Candidatus Acidoferrales bacterium]|jgi:capsular exopolysaccharide synthesis family protein|nr:polysaccharide biosynthesis tyrosine autokinase [Candidatus Acidoferrales bacterium]